MTTTRKTSSKARPRREDGAPKKKAAAPARTAPAARSHGPRGKQILLEQIESLGLLDRDTVEHLEDLASGLAEQPVGSTEHDAWDQALSHGLNAFTAAGGDNHPRQVQQALVTWLTHAARAPLTTEGLTEVLNALRKVIPYGGATLCLRDPDRCEVVPFLTVGFPVELIGRIRFQEGMGFSSWVATGKKPILYGSLHRNEAPDPDRVRSFMAVPLVVGNECLGVLSLGHAQDGAYDQGSLRRLLLAGGILSGLVQRHVARKQIASREIQDPETTLLAPGYLRRRLDEEVLRSRELGHAMSLFVLQLNELPDLVQQFGEEYRTRCRVELARLVRGWQGPTELAGHVEGDRILVLLPSARRDRAESRAGILRDLLEHSNFPRRKRMTVALGVAAYPGDAEDPKELESYADKALRRASPAQAPAERVEAMPVS